MPNYLTPGVYVEEVASGARPIEAVGTSTAGFVGCAPKSDALLNKAQAINNWAEFTKHFCPEENPDATPLACAVFGFFQNGGSRCYVVNVGTDAPITGGSGAQRHGLRALEPIDDIAIVAAPGYTTPMAYESLISHCEAMGDRVAVLDAAAQVVDVEQLTRVATPAQDEEDGNPALRPRVSDNGFGACYFPWLLIRNPFKPAELIQAPPAGHLAGVWAQTDATRGVHKAPANCAIRGALDLTQVITDAEQGLLNSNGVNAIRLFPVEGIRVWGARTIAPAASEWRYLNVRRLFNMIEESIAKSTRWVVFEPNDESLWKSITRDVSAFLKLIWRDGALQGSTPEQAFYVKCDNETNPQEVIDAGRVVIEIGIAPVKPAEFVIFRIGQYDGGADRS
jgi:uncharacterized protein